jgi:peptidoglycan hydrolase-like protein with peptidoglycan-binding domain
MPISTISLKLNFKEPQVKELHTKLDIIGLAVPKAELDAEAYGEGTQALVLQFQARYKLPQTGVFDDTTKAALGNAAALPVFAPSSSALREYLRQWIFPSERTAPAPSDSTAGFAW